MKDKYTEDKSPKKSPEAQLLCDKTKRILETPQPSYIGTWANNIEDVYASRIIRHIKDKDLSNLEK